MSVDTNAKSPLWLRAELLTTRGAGAKPIAAPGLAWAKTSDAGRHAIAEAVFERIHVLGVADYTFTLTAHAKACGCDAAFGGGIVRVKEGQSGRGERTRADTFQLSIRIVRGGRETPRLVRSA